MGYIIIPAKLCAMPGLSVIYKYVLAQLAALMAKTGYCFASDGTLADMLGVGERRTVQKYLNTLEKEGFIKREGRGYERRILPTEKMKALFFTLDENKNSEECEQKFRKLENKSSEAYEQKFSQNNKYNNINNNKDKVKDTIIFDKLYMTALERISKKDEVYKTLEKYSETVYRLCKEKFSKREDTVKNKCAYIRSLIVNTCKEDFRPAPEATSGQVNYDEAERRMWAALG